MTGQEMTELFFTKVKGWERTDTQYDKEDVFWGWLVPGGKTIARGRIPQLHTSLDLQDEWVWPELRKKGIRELNISDHPEINLFDCSITTTFVSQVSGYGQAPTKPLAQLEASLKALGVL